MVGLKVSEMNQTGMTPSPKKKDKKNKFEGKKSPSGAGKQVSSPSKSLNGAGFKKIATPAKLANGAGFKTEAVTPAKSSSDEVATKAAPNKKKGKNFGKFGNRNAVKVKDDVFSKMVKEEAVKENLSPAFLKKLDKCVARLPNAGKRFVNWLVHDVKYKIKFMPIVEEVFKLIKDMKVLPLPESGVAPKSAIEKKREKRLKRRKMMEDKKAAGILPPPKKENGDKRKSDEISGDVKDNEVASPDSKKKKKAKVEKVDVKVENTSDTEIADLSFSVNENDVSASEKKKKKKRKSLANKSDN